MSVSPLGITAGHCTACGKVIWRTATLQRDAWGLMAGHRFLLWPEPTSVYARVETQSGYAPGIAYHRECAPPLGADGPLPGLGKICGYDMAHDRYSNWYAPERENFYRTWLRDAVFLDGVDIDRLMKLWREDRGGNNG